MKDFVAIANQYIADVLSGAIVACKWTRLACQRQLDDLARQDSPDWNYFFDAQAGTDVCDFLELLSHIKGEKGGQFLDLAPWQCFFITTVFSWKRKDNPRLRRFRYSLLFCGKGNGKSFLSSGIGLYMLAADNEPGSEVICAARETSQARLVFDTAREQARANPRLCDMFGLTVLEHTILQKESASVMKPVSAQGQSLAGKIIHYCSLDETWSHKTRAVLDEMTLGVAKRNNSLLSTISHAGENLASVGYEQYTTATKILSGEIKDERTFCLVYSAEGFDWTSREAMLAANPNLGISVYEDTLIEAVERAQKIPSLQSSVRSHNLVEWVGSTTAWIDPQKVAACRVPDLRMEDFKFWHIGEPGITEPEHRPFAIGLDLASRQDIAAVIFLCVGYIDQVEHLYAFGKYYLPEKTIEVSPISQYRSWAKRGLITAMPGFSNDYGQIRKDILDIQRRHVGYGAVENEDGFKFVLCAADNWQAEQLSQELSQAGIQTAAFNKTAKEYSPVMDWLASLILGGRFHFSADDEVLLWAFTNVVCKRDVNENVFPRKAGDDPNRKIDPVIALLYSVKAAQTKNGSLMRPGDGDVPSIIFIADDGSAKRVQGATTTVLPPLAPQVPHAS